MPIVEVKKPKTILEGKKSKMVQEVAKQKTRVEDLAKALHNHPLDIGNHDPKDVAERILAGTVKKIYLEYDLQQGCQGILKYTPHFQSGYTDTAAILALEMTYDDVVSALDSWSDHRSTLTDIEVWEQGKENDFFEEAETSRTEENRKIWKDLGERLRKRSRT